jgi:hypothetical protein
VAASATHVGGGPDHVMYSPHSQLNIQDLGKSRGAFVVLRLCVCGVTMRSKAVQVVEWRIPNAEREYLFRRFNELEVVVRQEPVCPIQAPGSWACWPDILFLDWGNGRYVDGVGRSPSALSYGEGFVTGEAVPWAACHKVASYREV